MGARHRPRTRHLREDGTPRFTNRLILETSPYLLQHAHNPVNWFPWGEDAFRRARLGGKVVMLSIGYSTCHWCHVMERESFEDQEVAAYLNEYFIAVKVDREERPDVDGVYMKAVQAQTGAGGWPITVFLTPDRRPFLAGTYLPRDQLLTALYEVQARYQDDPDAVVGDAARLVAAIQPQDEWMRGDLPAPATIVRAVLAQARSFDPVWGGFGGALKFPRPVVLDLLLRYHRRTGDSSALAMVVTTLERMASGGIHDQLGGGFHRYSTDTQWLVPHFEKMLYDQAQLAVVYLDASQVAGRADFADVARRTLDYLRREMTSIDGGFYSATDADSMDPRGEEVEGYYFTWTPDELAAVLGAEPARRAGRYFGVTDAGNLDGRNVLHVARPLDVVAAELGIPADLLSGELERARGALLAARTLRIPPHRDDKIVASWNGLAISAFARAGFVLARDDYLAAARRAADFVLARLLADDGRLRRSFRAGEARIPAVLDDYAFVVQGLLDLWDATSEVPWLESALALHQRMELDFGDAAGGYAMTGRDSEALVARERPVDDGAEPSGNAVALSNALRIAEITGRNELRDRVARTLAGFSGLIGRAGSSAPRMLGVLDSLYDRFLQIVVVAPHDPREAAPLLAEVRVRYLPNRTLVVAVEGRPLESLGALVPFVDGKRALHGRPTAFVCERGSCRRPTSDPAELAGQLGDVRPLPEEAAGAPDPP
ncbi:MAG: thioredoxin domain-containing protein [Deltaproteobacteria bacterium]|nr:thioredoxin domain-containing protein [Deltaproteobacteria bacterium]